MKKFDEYPILAVTSDDESYPFGMRKMSNNSVIYYKGDISLINATKNIAVIGTRKISDKGRKLALCQKAESALQLCRVGLNRCSHVRIINWQNRYWKRAAV